MSLFKLRAVLWARVAVAVKWLDQSCVRHSCDMHTDLSSANALADLFAAYITPFAECPPLGERVLRVLIALPGEVQRDFLDDPRFRVTLCNYVPNQGWKFHIELPETMGDPSRCVVLRPKLAHLDLAFALYVIAHEFAHAYLRNGGWGEIHDVEDAADALAASWGFVRPGTG